MYDRRINGETLELRHSGRLLENAFVLFDTRTQSRFCQATGSCAIGPLAGSSLTRLPAFVAPWKSWRALHPATRVMLPPKGSRFDYSRKNVYDDYARSQRIGIHPLSRLDERLPAKSLVLGVAIAGAARCWTARSLSQQRVQNDRVGTTDVVLAWDPAGWGTCFERRFEGRTLTFSAGPGTELVDDAGSRWDMAGRCVDGPARGKRLTVVPSVVCYWFSWQAHRPDTTVSDLRR